MAERFKLDGSGARLDLGMGITLTAPGLRGVATVHGLAGPGTRGPELSTDSLNETLSRAGMSTARTIQLDVAAVPAPTTAPVVRNAAAEDALLLEIPDPGPETGVVVLAVDEGGIATWQFAEAAAGPGSGVTRGARSARSFKIRRHSSTPPATGDEARRGLVRAIGKKILKVLVYKITDPVVGKISEVFAEKWEAKHRPYRLRPFGPDDYATKEVAALSAERISALGAGRSLLFLHGTFSTTHGGFCDIPREFVEEVNRQYEGRVFAFDHHTLSHSPIENAEQLQAALRPLREVRTDIVCHSRGGLFARTLAERGTGEASFDVKKIIFVGVPNHGTALTRPEHMVDMLDRYTNLLNLFPTGAVTEVLDCILTVVKVLGHGVLKGLDGLRAMDPDGGFLRELNGGSPVGATYHAITADYEPQLAGLRDLVKTAADRAIDRVFDDRPNDMVVPTLGVFEDNGSPEFPIAADRVFRFGNDLDVIHTNYFAQKETIRQIRNWLRH